MAKGKSWILNMGPLFSVNYIPDRGLAHSKSLGNLALIIISFRINVSNFLYIVISKFNFTSFFTNLGGSVLMFVFTIRLRRIPSKIIEKIIRTIPIIVTTHMLGGTWSYKSQKNETMDMFRKLFTILRKNDSKISSISGESCFLNIRSILQYVMPYCPKRPDSPMIGNFIPRIIRNIFPLFHVWIKLIITHGLGLLNRLRLWGEPLSLLTQSCGSLYL